MHAALALASAWLVYFRAAPAVQAWLFFITLISLIILTSYAVVTESQKITLYQKYRTLISSIGKVAGSAPDDIFKSAKSLLPKKLRPSRGLVIAVGLGLVFITLFATADKVIGSWLSNFDSWLNFINADLVGTFMRVGFFSLISLFTLYLLTSTASDIAKPLSTRKLLDSRDTTLILSTLCLIFAGFLTVQAGFLFTGNSLPEGITYADYARSGYGQLLLVTLLASSVVIGILSFSKQNITKKHQILALALIVLNVVVVASAWKRLSLYEAAYGWTMLRFIARLGLISITIGSISLALWTVRKITTDQLFISGWIITASVLLVAAGLNPEGIIAHRNLAERPVRNIPTDINYLSGLSGDSLPSICGSAKSLKNNSSYVDEYTQLRDSLNAKQYPTNSGLNRHHTLTKPFIDQYRQCLK